MAVENQELRKAGLKVTLPRVKILQILESTDEGPQHMSAEDLYRALLDAGEEAGVVPGEIGQLPRSAPDQEPPTGAEVGHEVVVQLAPLPLRVLERLDLQISLEGRQAVQPVPSGEVDPPHDLIARRTDPRPDEARPPALS